MNKPKSDGHLSRIIHPERSGILCDKMGVGDISSWAHATSKPFGTQFKPIRPEIGRIRAAFSPIRNLASINPIGKVFRPSKRETQVFQQPTKFDKDEHESKRVRATMAAVTFFDDLYRKQEKACVVKTGATPEVTKDTAGTALKDCRRTGKHIIAKLKANEVPRGD